MHARDRLHAKRVTARVTQRQRREEKREREKWKNKSPEDAFARPEVVRICTSSAYRNTVACEVAVVFLVSFFFLFFLEQHYNRAPIHGCIVSLTGDHLYARATLGETPVVEPKQFQRNGGWKVPRSVGALTSSLDRDAQRSIFMNRSVKDIVRVILTITLSFTSFFSMTLKCKIYDINIFEFFTIFSSSIFKCNILYLFSLISFSKYILNIIVVSDVKIIESFWDCNSRECIF